MKNLNTQNCGKCGSDKIVPGLEVIDTIVKQHVGVKSNIVTRIEKEPNAIFDKEPQDSKIEAFVCGECGFIELYARSPQVLVQAYKEIVHKIADKR